MQSEVTLVATSVCIAACRACLSRASHAAVPMLLPTAYCILCTTKSTAGHGHLFASMMLCTASQLHTADMLTPSQMHHNADMLAHTVCLRLTCTRCITAATHCRHADPHKRTGCISSAAHSKFGDAHSIPAVHLCHTSGDVGGIAACRACLVTCCTWPPPTQLQDTIVSGLAG